MPIDLLVSVFLARDGSGDRVVGTVRYVRLNNGYMALSRIKKMKEFDFGSNLTVLLLIFGIMFLCLMFCGDPDLMDGIIYWLSDGKLLS